MRIFVYEHLSGGGALGSSLSPSLAQEGLTMVLAMVSDLQAVPGISVRLMLDSRIPAVDTAPDVEVFRVSHEEEARDLFQAMALGSDGTLLIAPELEGELERLARQVCKMGGNLLGSIPEAIQLASDKLLLPRILQRRGVPCVPSTLYRGANGNPFPYPSVVKPRRGAGSTDTFLVERPDQRPVPEQPTIVTPLMPGLPVSVLVIAGPRGRIALTACEQVLSEDGRFRYLGGRLPLPEALDKRAGRLAMRAVGAIPGLSGFVGVDLLLSTKDGDERDDRVVELNSRLTTSYVGLRALSHVNLAQCWLELVTGGEPPALAWKSGSFHFRPDGTLEAREE